MSSSRCNQISRFYRGFKLERAHQRAQQREELAQLQDERGIDRLLNEHETLESGVDLSES